MKIVGDLGDYFLELAPESYNEYMAKENGKKVNNIVVMKSIYVILEALL